VLVASVGYVRCLHVADRAMRPSDKSMVGDVHFAVLSHFQADKLLPTSAGAMACNNPMLLKLAFRTGYVAESKKTV